VCAPLDPHTHETIAVQVTLVAGYVQFLVAVLVLVFFKLPHARSIYLLGGAMIVAC
jgi:hypothetical protein